MYPCLQINLAQVEGNARQATILCQRFGMNLLAVTKAVGALPEIAHACLAGGAVGLADSRLQNIQRLRRAGISAPLWLLRSPTISEAAACAALADGSFHTELAVLKQLSTAARQQSRKHEVYLMVEMGDLREGIMPADLPGVYTACRDYPGLDVVGLGTNLACFAGVKPTAAAMDNLVQLAQELDAGRALKISAGNSSAIQLMLQGGWQDRWHGAMDHLRIGESLLLGWDIFDGSPLPGFGQRAFVLRAEVLEVKKKPSLPLGPRGRDAFGQTLEFADRGLRRRALVSLGRQDFGAGSLFPLQSGVEILGATSDHLVLDVEDAADVAVGTILEFGLDYGALLALSTSAYVDTVLC